tara:strand:- start:413 stop:754 length:342 start_codon:yes stop_codon:yes gene_type:complete
MPRIKKGELQLPRIRELAHALNDVLQIKGISTMKRQDLIRQIQGKGYIVNHEKELLEKTNRKKIPTVPLPKSVETKKKQKRKAFLKKKPRPKPINKGTLIAGKIKLKAVEDEV